MCGISGLVNCGGRETLVRMTNVQRHRGPDDSGLWERRFPDGEYIGLGSRRLAILDLSANGHMPMSNEGSMLPDEIMRQPKAGFAAPVDYWLANDLRPMMDDLLSESQVKRRGLFRPEVVRRYIDEHRRGAEDWSMQIWQLLTLEIWMQLFLDGGARSFAERQIASQRTSQPVLSRPVLSRPTTA